ncbi:MAG: hypothetical protein KDD82_00030, partial [Planctomycetes bacterium]|nr:hypothetical protein [Planctomycetota bacterium]
MGEPGAFGVNTSRLTRGVALWLLCALSCWGQGDPLPELEAARAAEPARGLALVERALEGELSPAQRERARL